MPRRSPAPRRPAPLRAAGLACLGLALAAAAGCALQSDMLEMEDEVSHIKALQHELEVSLDQAKEAAETMRAMGFRLEAMEAKLKEGTQPDTEARLNKELKDLETALDSLAQERKTTEARLKEAETFFVGRLEGVSSRQQGLSGRLSALEGQGVAGPGEQAARAEVTADLGSLKQQVADERKALEAVQGQFGLLTDRVAQLAAAQATAQGAQAGLSDQAAQALQTRLTAVETQTGAAAAAQGRLTEQIGQLTDRLEKMDTESQARAQAEAAHQAALSQDAAGALEARLAALEAREAQREAQRVQAEQQLTAQVGQLADRVGQMAAAQQQTAAQQAALSKDAAGALADRMRAMEQGEVAAQAAQQRLEAQVREVAARLADLNTGEQQRAALSADDAGRLSARIDALEKGGAQGREQLAGQMGQIVDRLVALEKGDDAPPAVKTALAGMDARVAKLEAGGEQVQRLKELTDQLGLLGSQVTQRLDAQSSDFARVAARLDRMEKGVSGFQEAPPAWGAALDKKVTFLADTLTPRVDTQGKEISALADTVGAARERTEDRANRLDDRVNTLGTSVVQRLDGLDERVGEIEKTASAPPAASPVDQARLDALGRKVDVLGKEVPAKVDDLSGVVTQVRDQLDRVGKRIALLETIQKQDSADLRERFNALSAALADISRNRPAP